MSQVTDGYDLTSHHFWGRTPEERRELWKVLRHEQPFSWHGPRRSGPTGGFWAVVRFDDVREISRDTSRFVSRFGVSRLDPELFGLDPDTALGDATKAMSAVLGAEVMVTLDSPEHDRLRGLIQKAFTPRHVRMLEEQIRADARRIVGELEAGEEGDFVDRVAKRLPLVTISRMLGVPESDSDRLCHYIDAVVSYSDPTFLDGRNALAVLAESVMGISQYAAERAAQARAHGGDDLVGALVAAEVAGERLTDAEIGAFFFILTTAGNDTTRNTTSLAMKALCDFPDQRGYLLEDPAARLAVAVEEFVRWACPITNFLRTAVCDTEVSGHPIAEGEQVMMIYESANRDEQAFDEPDRFNVARSPNHHVSFGAGGPHHCLGAALARVQLSAVFGELLAQFPELEVGEPEYLSSTLVSGVRAMPMHTGPKAGVKDGGAQWGAE